MAVDKKIMGIRDNFLNLYMANLDTISHFAFINIF